MATTEAVGADRRQIKEDCDFCTLPQTRGTVPFRRMYGLDQVLNVPQLPSDFLVMQDVVPLGEEAGHVLMIPKAIGSGHDISLAMVENQETVARATSSTVEMIQQGYPGKPIFTFEHGPGFVEGEQIACGGCHLDHAHGHILVLPNGTQIDPIKQTLENILQGSGWAGIEQRAKASDRAFTNIADIANLNPYLQIGMIHPDGSQRAFTYVQQTRDEHVESQLLRRVIAGVVFDQHDPMFWHYKDVQMGLTTPERLEQLMTQIVLFRAKVLQA